MPWTHDILHPRIKASSSEDTPLYLWTYQWGEYQLTSTWSISKYIHQKLPKKATKNALETCLKLTDGEALTHKSSRKPGNTIFENAFYNWWQPSYHSKHVQWQCRSVLLNLQKENADCIFFCFIFGWILFALLLLVFFVMVWCSAIYLFFLCIFLYFGIFEGYSLFILTALFKPLLNKMTTFINTKVISNSSLLEPISLVGCGVSLQ